MTSKLLYSTDSRQNEIAKLSKKSKSETNKSTNYVPSSGPTKMRLETKGRGGKAVTVLFHLPFTEDQAKQLMKDLQTILGIGATFKNATIELRGDVRDKVAQYFAKKSWQLVRAGG